MLSETKRNKWNWDSWISGIVGGGSGILMSHPFDTIKTYHQSNNTKSVLDATYKIIKRTGPLSLYRGVIPPFFGMGLEKAIVFGVQDNFSKNNLIDNYYFNIFISGVVAGISCATVVTPVEKFKIGMQNGLSFTEVYHKNIKASSFNLSIKNLYCGLSSTLLREGPGFGIYFTTYNFLKNNTEGFTPLHAMLYGAFSGSMAWAFMYPSDPLKTIQQNKNISFKSAINQIYSTYGITGFYRGFYIALGRAIPLHAGVFGGIEMLNYVRAL